MPEIHALQGPSNSGKSSTINLLAGLITAKYPNATVQIHQSGKDIKMVVLPVNGHKVGIESQGDPNSRLQQSLVDLKNANCDIIFCACRTRGMTVGWINSMSPPYTTNFHQQTLASRSKQNASNSAMAARLMQSAGI